MWRKLINLWREDNLLEQAWQESYKMLEIDQEMFLEAVQILRETTGTDVDEEVRSKDKLVDAYEQDVRRKVLTHCALSDSSQVPGGMALVTIVVDIERIGDYIKHMIDIAANYPKQLHGGKYEEDLQRVEEAVKENFARTRACIESSDEREAAKLLQDYSWVKQACFDQLMTLISNMEAEMPAAQAAALALYFRFLKRINSHLLNITTSVIKPFDMIGVKK